MSVHSNKNQQKRYQGEILGVIGWQTVFVVAAICLLNNCISSSLSNYGGQQPIPIMPQTQQALIADSLQGDDPHGPDPHDEIHDKGLPANQARDERKPPEDVYGGHELDERKAKQKKDDDRFAADARRN